jgi:DNA polymerase-3 subunit gamma/tau
MRDALSLTDQAIAYGGGKVEAAAVEAMLGTVRRDYLFDLLDALAAQNGDVLLDHARKLAERGIAFDAALQDLGNLLTQLALMLHAPNAVETTADTERMQAAADQLDVETVQLYYQIALNGRRGCLLRPMSFPVLHDAITHAGLRRCGNGCRMGCYSARHSSLSACTN